MRLFFNADIYILFNSLTRSSLHQMPEFHQQQQNRAQNHLQSTTLTTTSGLGSNFTSYTTDPIDSSLGSSNNSDHNHHHHGNRKNGCGAGTSTSFIESDIGTNDEYLFIPEAEHDDLMIPQQQQQQMMMNFDGGEMREDWTLFTPVRNRIIIKHWLFSRFPYQVSTFHRTTSKLIHSYSILRHTPTRAQTASLISRNTATSIISSITSRPFRLHLAHQTVRP